jgi:hypothetical protein
MSTGLAIASVTAVLKDLLNNGVIDHDVSSSVGNNVLVTALPPDRIDVSDSNQQSQLNLFLYQVTPNQGWRNEDLPSRNSNGDRISNPPLALDLHYMLSAYGVKDLHGEILLGYGMQILHETPVLPREAIRRALAPPLPVNGGVPSELKNLFTSELAEQVEQIKICPLSLTTEEISRLWTAFQARYRPTAAYQASVVLIQSRQSTRPALPVRARNLYVVPFQQPIIERLASQASDGAPMVGNQPILSGYNLVIIGQNLLSDSALVNVGGVELEPDVDKIQDTRIVIQLPASLPAGLQGVQVQQRTLMGSPPVPHTGVGSNIAAFVLRPVITPLSVTNVVTAPSGLRSATVAVRFVPGVQEGQRVLLVLNEFNPPSTRPALAYSFNAPTAPLLSPPSSTDLLSIPIDGVAPGIYLARAQVDGAESPLGTDASGSFNSPQVAIP